MRSALWCVVACGMVAAVAGCSDDGLDESPFANECHLYLLNTSSLDLEVVMTPGPAYSWPSSGRITVAAGDSVQICNAYATPPDFPSPSDAILCLSLFDVADDSLVYQESPVRDEDWDAMDSTAKIHTFGLGIDDGSLSAAKVDDRCGH